MNSAGFRRWSCIIDLLFLLLPLFVVVLCFVSMLCYAVMLFTLLRKRNSMGGSRGGGAGGFFVMLVRISSARQRNAISMAVCWRADDGPIKAVFGSSIPPSTKNVIKFGPL